MAQRGAECWREPGEETGQRGAEAGVHAANWAEVGSGLPAGCSFQKLPALAEGVGWGPLGAFSHVGHVVRPPPAQSAGGGAAGWVEPGLPWGRDGRGGGQSLLTSGARRCPR